MHLLFLNSESIVEWLRYYFSIKTIPSSAPIPNDKDYRKGCLLMGSLLFQRIVINSNCITFFSGDSVGCGDADGQMLQFHAERELSQLFCSWILCMAPNSCADPDPDYGILSNLIRSLRLVSSAYLESDYVLSNSIFWEEYLAIKVLSKCADYRQARKQVEYKQFNAQIINALE